MENPKISTEEFVRRALEVHGSTYDYSKSTYVNRHKRIIIICPSHGEFLQLPGDHYKGKGCRYCAKNVLSDTATFIKRAQTIHGNKYNYSKVEYINALTKTTIICKIHGEFLQCPNEHLRGKQCRKCAYKERHNNNGFKWETYIFPDGRLEKVQGYESLTIKYLISSSIHYNDIVLSRKDKPIISYDWKEKSHNYFPDCYIPSTNTIVETKSLYTWKSQEGQNFAKISGSLKEGYNIRVIVWDRKKQLISDIIYGNS